MPLKALGAKPSPARQSLIGLGAVELSEASGRRGERRQPVSRLQEWRSHTPTQSSPSRRRGPGALSLAFGPLGTMGADFVNAWISAVEVDSATIEPIVWPDATPAAAPGTISRPTTRSVSMAREGQPRDLSDELFEGTYGARDFDRPVAELKRFPDSGMAGDTAYLLLHDLLQLDGATGLNLASFVTTWMDDHAKRIVTEGLGKNHIDHEEYPAAHRIEEICVRLLADLWNAPDHLDPVGVGTIGSSEAIMLGLLAHKWNWRARQDAAGRPTDKPNVVYGAETHVVWDKFARYFDVEARRVPMDPDRFIIDIADVRERVDENTIALGAVLGTTFIGQVDPIPSLNDMCADIKATQGWDIPIHVDAASGGFVAPFSEPEFEWDFRLEHVRSINASGHKYGLVYPGVGWLVLKDRAFLPDDLVFNVNYLGAGQPTYTLNFSRGSAMIQAQLYNFLRLGREGYARIVQNMLGNAEYLTERLAEMGRFRMLNDRLPEPVVTFTFAENPGFDEFALAERLRSDGWIMPAYTLPPNAQDTKLLRVVVKERLSRTLVDSLLGDIDTAWAELSANPPTPRPGSAHPRPC